MIFAIYEITTGKIVSRLSAANVETAQMNCALGQSILPAQEGITDVSHYVDVSQQSFVPIPPRLTEFDTWDWNTKTWLSPNLSVLKDASISVLKASRDSAIFGGFYWDGSKFDSDIVAQSRLLGLYVDSMRPDYQPTHWRLQDNSWRELTAGDVSAAYQALSTHVRTNFIIFAELEAAVNAATTPLEISEVVWPA